MSECGSVTVVDSFVFTLCMVQCTEHYEHYSMCNVVFDFGFIHVFVIVRAIST